MDERHYADEEHEPGWVALSLVFAEGAANASFGFWALSFGIWSLMQG